MKVNFWVDPICPWCWMTARWVVEVVAPSRDLEVTWNPISLFHKNNPDSHNPFYKKMVHTNGLLRVMESVNEAQGNKAAFAFYWEAGKSIHHDKEAFVSAEKILLAANLDVAHSSAFSTDAFDDALKTKMEKGLALVGADVGTPILSFEQEDGSERGIFGPVISEIPQGDAGLQVWDSMVHLATMDGFWELKRTRTVQPNFGERPA